MVRYRFLPDSWPGFRIHKIVRSDGGRELHDHPFSFFSFILTGGYYEYRDDGTCTWYGPMSVIFRKAETLHRLELPPRYKKAPTRRNQYNRARDGEQPAWTFVVRGPYRREWGFDVKGKWVPWQEYHGIDPTPPVAKQ